MARTERFRIQHNELLAIAGELQPMLTPDFLTKDAAAARSVLSKLLGKLVVHLSAEDNSFYPELMGSADPALASLAKRFSTEMKSTAATVNDYNSRWMVATKIRDNPAAFIKETKQLLGVLADRIKRENQELYAAADKLVGATF